MLLTKLVQGLGALSLAHLAFAAEDPLDRRTNDDSYDPLCWGCPKSTVTKTASATATATVTVTKTASPIVRTVTTTCTETETKTRT